jgi:hypothetical protein
MLNIRQEERENRIMNYPKFDDINIGDFINYSEVIAKKYHQIYVRDTTGNPFVYACFIPRCSCQFHNNIQIHQRKENGVFICLYHSENTRQVKSSV